jgi:hypothetical protein
LLVILGRRNPKTATTSNAGFSLSELALPPSGMWNDYRREWTDNLETANAIGDGHGFPLGGADSRQELATSPALCHQRKHSKVPGAETSATQASQLPKNVKFEVKSDFLIGDKMIFSILHLPSYHSLALDTSRATKAA